MRFAKAHTSRPLKVTLPGPLTIVDSVVDEHYRADERELALRFAKLLNEEARALAEAGADVIQFDEPTFNVYVDKVRDWGVAALERCVDGVKATTAVHICYGYGISQVLAWKNSNRDWSHYSHTLPLLAESRIDQVSVECAASGVDPAVLRSLKNKDVLVGVIDVGTEEVETAEVVAGPDPRHPPSCRAGASVSLHRLWSRAQKSRRGARQDGSARGGSGHGSARAGSPRIGSKGR